MLEFRLTARFETLVGGLCLPSLIVLQEEDRPARDLERFQLVPIVIKGLHGPWTRTYDEAGLDVVIPEGVRTNFQSKGARPHMDHGLGIGLVFDDELEALASAGLADNGHLRLTQLHGVGRSDQPAKARCRGGLYKGFRWRHTLVNGWLEVASACRVEAFEIEGAANNVYDTVNGALYGEPFTAGYDQVAEDLGFDPDERGDWVKWLGASTGS